MQYSNLYRSKMAVLLISINFGCIQGLSYAQDAKSTTDSTNKEEMERIIVTSQSGDAAMRAFNAGDFTQAEIKFSENAKCAFREERNRQATIEAVQNAQLNQELSGAPSSANSSITDSNASRIDGRFSPASNFKKNQREKSVSRDISCDNRAFQIYMAGMSQLQLGRTDEAEANFERAVALSQNLYDAHHRLALINLLRRDNDAAESHLSAIKSMLRRCLTCDARDEILARADFIQKALDGKIRIE